MVEALDLCELYCETVRDNTQAIASEKQCPLDLEEAVITLIYCAHRTEIKELNAVVKQFRKKYGNEFVSISETNRGNVVNDNIVHKLSGQRPNAFLVVSYMKEIAHIYQVDWTPDEADQELAQRFDTAMYTPTGGAGTKGAASGLGGGAYAITDGRILRPGQVPLGYVPPVKLDSDINVNEDDDDDDDDNNDPFGDGGDGGGGGNIPLAVIVPREEDGVQGHSVRGNEELSRPPQVREQYVEKKQPKAKPAPVQKKKETDIDALAARFAALKKL